MAGSNGTFANWALGIIAVLTAVGIGGMVVTYADVQVLKNDIGTVKQTVTEEKQRGEDRDKLQNQMRVDLANIAVFVEQERGHPLPHSYRDRVSEPLRDR